MPFTVLCHLHRGAPTRPPCLVGFLLGLYRRTEILLLTNPNDSDNSKDKYQCTWSLLIYHAPCARGRNEGKALQLCHGAVGSCYSSAAPSTGQGCVTALAKTERSRLHLGDIKPEGIPSVISDLWSVCQDKHAPSFGPLKPQFFLWLVQNTISKGLTEGKESFTGRVIKMPSKIFAWEGNFLLWFWNAHTSHCTP